MSEGRALAVSSASWRCGGLKTVRDRRRPRATAHPPANAPAPVLSSRPRRKRRPPRRARPPAHRPPPAPTPAAPPPAPAAGAPGAARAACAALSVLIVLKAAAGAVSPALLLTKALGAAHAGPVNAALVAVATSTGWLLAATLASLQASRRAGGVSGTNVARTTTHARVRAMPPSCSALSRRAPPRPAPPCHPVAKPPPSHIPPFQMAIERGRLEQDTYRRMALGLLGLTAVMGAVIGANNQVFALHVLGRPAVLRCGGAGPREAWALRGAGRR